MVCYSYRMNYPAVCFDMDGVIVDSESTHKLAFQMTLSDIGITLTDKDYDHYFAGKTDEKGYINYYSSLHQSLSRAELEKLLSHKSQYYLSLASSSLKAYETTVQVIKELSHTHRLALVTGSSKPEVATALASLDLMRHFPVIVTADDVTFSKPHPEGYLQAATLLNRPPHECIVVEDSPSGVAAAKNAGMYCIGLTTTHLAAALSNADITTKMLNSSLFTAIPSEQ